MKRFNIFTLVAAICVSCAVPACVIAADGRMGDTGVSAAQEDEAVAEPRDTKRKSRRKVDKGPAFKLDRALVESGWFQNSAAPASSNYAHVSASLNWQPSREWEFQLGARVDGYLQGGTPDSDRLRADYAENFVRWRGKGMRFTLGTQNVSWGRTDEFPPTDRLSRVDLSRFNLDPLANRRRAVPAARLEKSFDEYKLDVVWVPSLQTAVLPTWEDVWHPVDRRRGRILGTAPSPALTALVQNGSFAEDKGGAGGGGVRVTRTGGSVDWGLSLQRARQSTPYYRMNPALRNELIVLGNTPAVALANVTGPTFTAVHPMSTIAGAEIEFQGAGATWRLEATRSSDTPATTEDLRYLLVPSTDVVAGVEFYPGDAETRATLQLASHSLRTSESLIERKTFNAFTGEIEHPFAQGRWRLNVRFLAGLNHHDGYLNPKLTYRGFEPHEIYVGAHLYSGDDRGFGGFHRDHDMVVLGWQVRY